MNKNIIYNNNSTKKELLNVISQLKKSEIVSILNNHNQSVNNQSINNQSVNNNSVNDNFMNNESISIKASKKKIKIPSNLNSLKFKEVKPDNKYYKNV